MQSDGRMAAKRGTVVEVTFYFALTKSAFISLSSLSIYS
jgi:hypothetical protein